MDCNVVRDLIPLYIDNCCSGESAKLVREHIETCKECRNVYENMKIPCEKPLSAPPVCGRINEWKASVMQSLLLFFSFALITVGVAAEAYEPSGIMNGFWALTLVIPAVSFMLSLANWYFIRLYKSRKSFSNGSLFANIMFAAFGYAWAAFHYKADFSLFVEKSLPIPILLRFGAGILILAAACVLSKLLSLKYAAMLGKEQSI